MITGTIGDILLILIHVVPAIIPIGHREILQTHHFPRVLLQEAGPYPARASIVQTIMLGASGEIIFLQLQKR
jgi:hypothetical protein